ncbi:hypothetical protein PSTG_06609 [Puccinia striiformis f. sp. tritici PST-78]|uniref:Uncharacterized protein n=1 Tax=Puccinia striiformis f. sp. tritici PST-78 TaxID=1165861 RepID=A0A0L0VLP6_9BASI|nr:hypothetical protein PSTG_06609 [Puccinia striiformis f. sp. tritici PST-78]
MAIIRNGPKPKKSAIKRCFGGTSTGWPTTLQLLKSIRGVVSKRPRGKDLWEDFILSKKPPRGSYPKGAYHNANRISPFLFSSKSKNERNEDLSKKHMPFLFNLLASKLADRPARRKKDNPKDTVDVADSCSEASEPSDIEEEEEYMFNGKSRNIPKPKLLLDHGQQASKACIQQQHTFISKRRHNGHQIANSISFLACGVTDRISKLLQFIGLSASQRTAQNVLKSQPPSRKTDQYIDVPYSPNTSTLPLL